MNKFLYYLTCAVIFIVIWVGLASLWAFIFGKPDSLWIYLMIALAFALFAMIKPGLKKLFKIRDGKK